MYIFSVINTLADLAMLWLFVAASRPEDQNHPLFHLVASSTGPYFFNMFPTIMNSALFGMDIHGIGDIKQALKTFEMIYLRDVTFKSIMLGAYCFTVIFGGLFVASGLFCSIRRNREMKKKELVMRTGIPLAAGLIFCMAFYNGFFDISKTTRHANWAFGCLVVSHFIFLATLICGMFSIRKITSPTEIQMEGIRNFQSLHIFALISSVPMFFMEFQMFFTRSAHFMFSDYESFVRLIFFTSILLLEPFNSRFRFRERFYRASHFDSPVGPAPSSVQVVKPIPKKEDITDSPPNYGPPDYDSANSMPISWGPTQAEMSSKRYQDAKITPVEEH